MATFTITAKQQQRNDTAANWASKNPILLVGEIGIESNTGKLKCGNGVTHWNSLAYIGITTEYLENNYIKKTEKGAVNGVASLDADGKVAQEAKSSWKVICDDNRNDNLTPETYMKRGMGVYCEFKYNNKIGLNAGPTYSAIVIIVPWSDSSGGYPTQIAFNSSGSFIRVGTTIDAWSAWDTFALIKNGTLTAKTFNASE